MQDHESGAFINTSEELTRRSIERRAVEAAIWGMPLVNFDAMRQAYFRNAGAQYNDVIYWSKPSDWKNQVTTPNASTNYVMFFANLTDGPLVVDVPPVDGAALFGTLIDSWNTPLIDVGNEGEDRGRGGKYVLLPPGRESPSTNGHFPVSVTTYNAYGLLRVIPETGSHESVSKAITYLKKLRLYPLSSLASPPPSRFIDLSDKRFEGIPRYDASFFTSLARMVAEEPVKERDLTIMGQLRSLGIGKGMKFEPSIETVGILTRAAREAHAFMAEGFRKQGALYWPERKWKLLATDEIVRSKATFVSNDRVMLDERAFIFFGAFGGTHNPPPNLYLKTFEDRDGAALNGSSIYRLRVPANVPTTQFWAIVAYDVQTAGFIRESSVVGLDSYSRTMKKNADGSVDIYFAPKAPPGQETNWISTASGKPFFLLFRNYAPDDSVLTKTSDWVMSDLERVK